MSFVTKAVLKCGLAVIALLVSLSHTASAFPVSVTDARGVWVTERSAPRRIVSLTPATTEMLFALGMGSRVVGDTTYCDYPPAARRVAKIGDVRVNYERVVALRPDLVVGDVVGDFDRDCPPEPTAAAGVRRPPRHAGRRGAERSSAGAGDGGDASGARGCRAHGGDAARGARTGDARPAPPVRADRHRHKPAVRGRTRDVPEQHRSQRRAA